MKQKYNTESMSTKNAKPEIVRKHIYMMHKESTWTYFTKLYYNLHV